MQLPAGQLYGELAISPEGRNAASGKTGTGNRKAGGVLATRGKRTSGRRRAWILPLLLASAIAAAAQGTPAGTPAVFGWKSESVPLAINVEGKPVRSSLYLHYEFKTYGSTLEQFGAQRMDEREKLFFQGMRAMRIADEAGLKAIWQNPASNGKVTVGYDKMDAKTYLEKYASGYGKFEGLKIISRIELGSDSMFLWAANASNGVFWPDGSIIHASASQRQVFTPVTPSLPVANIIVDNTVASLTTPQSYTAQDVHPKYHSALNLQGKSGPGAHPVSLLFDGMQMNFNVFEAAAPAPHPSLAFYRDAYNLLKKRAFPEFTKMFLPESQKGVTQWAERMGADDARPYFEAMTSARYVKFLLEADPIFIVFYSSDPTDKWTASSLHHDYVVRDPQSGSFKLANLLFMSSLDDLLNDTDQFSTQMFRRGDATVAPQTKGVK